AFQFVKQNLNLYNLIVVDLYVDTDVPPIFETAEFFKYLKKALSLGGMIIFNKYAYDKKTEKQSKDLFNTFNKSLGNITVHKVSKQFDNYMLIYEKKAPVSLN
ncbi:MAG: hypothetical protein V2A54_09750, partial [Bacteroidota bacterium]